MIRIAVCDDMPGYGDIFGNVIEEWARKKGIKIELKKYVSGEELMSDVEGTGYFHIVFLDIELEGGMDGIITATQIKEQYRDVCLVFVSQYDNYYKEVFGLHPFQYLEKPVMRKQLTECLEQALINCRCLQEVFVFRFKGITSSVRVREILYFESNKRMVRICMENGDKYMFYSKLDRVENILSKYNHLFLRIHKSYLVNAAQIFQYYPKYVIMRNKERLPVSTRQREYVMQNHMKCLERLC